MRLRSAVFSAAGPGKFRPREFVTLLMFVLPAIAAWDGRASDWPQLLGPTRNAVYTGPALLETWPAEGPKVLWSSAAGEGYSSPVVSDGHVVLCHRAEEELLVTS